MSNRTPGVCTEASLFFCSERVFSISLNSCKRNQSSDNGVYVLAHLTKEGQLSRSGFVLRPRILTHLALSKECYPLVSLARITFITSFVIRKEIEKCALGELKTEGTQRCLWTQVGFHLQGLSGKGNWGRDQRTHSPPSTEVPLWPEPQFLALISRAPLSFTHLYNILFHLFQALSSQQ